MEKAKGNSHINVRSETSVLILCVSHLMEKAKGNSHINVRSETSVLILCASHLMEKAKGNSHINVRSKDFSPDFVRVASHGEG
jgi:hypothetical protein